MDARLDFGRLVGLFEHGVKVSLKFDRLRGTI
jgi:hypothetical protein